MAVALGLAGAALAGPAHAQVVPRPADEAAPKRAPQMTAPPELLENVEPTYPPAALAENRMGEVQLSIVIDERGDVYSAEIVSGEHTDLNWAALGAATRLKFKPAEIDGKPGRVAILFSFGFFFEPEPELPDEEEDPEWADALFEDQADTAGSNGNSAGQTGEQSPKKRAPLSVVGYARAAASKKGLAGAQIAVLTQPGDGEEPQIIASATADDAGRFGLRGVPDGTYTIAIASSDFDRFQTTETIEAGKQVRLIAYLVSADDPYVTVVRKKRARKEVARVTLSRDEVRKIPGTFGDPIRVIENLPGLARAPLAGGALIVRGANPQDSGVYFDGVEIPLLYHFGGLTSVVNAEFLETIDFYPGGFGARYGRATAGVVDVESRDLKMDDFKGAAEMDLLDAGFFFGGPLKLSDSHTLRFAVAARRSYIDGILPALIEAFTPPDTQTLTAAPVYWDYQAKVALNLDAHNKLQLFGFGSQDDLAVIIRGVNEDEVADFGTSTQFHRAVLRVDSKYGAWRHRFQPMIGLDVAAFGASSDTGINAGTESTNFSWGLRDTLDYQPAPWLRLTAGLDIQNSTFGFDANLPVPASVGAFPRAEPEIAGTNQRFRNNGAQYLLGGYVEAEVGPLAGLTFLPGVRFDHNTFSFDEETLPDGTVREASTVSFANVDPRLTVRWEVLKDMVFKGAFGAYHQPPQPLQTLRPFGTPDLTQPTAYQWIAGVEAPLSGLMSVDLQWYYTRRTNLVQRSSYTRDLGNGVLEPVAFTNEGRGRTFGLELLLRHELTDHLFGWIAYTLSRTEIDTSESRDAYVLTSFDQTHILTIVAQTKLPYKITLGGRFRLVSGAPQNTLIGGVNDLDTANFNSLNNSLVKSRKTPFNQLDIRVDRKWVFDTFSLTAYLDLLNVYNAQNVEFLLSDYRYRKQAPVTSLPILPVIGVLGEF